MWAFFFIAWDLQSQLLRASAVGDAGKGVEPLASFHDCAIKHGPSRGFFRRALLAHEQTRWLELGIRTFTRPAINGDTPETHTPANTRHPDPDLPDPNQLPDHTDHDTAVVLQKMMRAEHYKFFTTVSRAGKIVLNWIGELCGVSGLSETTTGAGMSIVSAP